MALYTVRLGGAPYVTVSPTLAADFRAWGYRVEAYPPLHHNVVALLTMQRSEGFDQTAREAELMDIWCAEWIGKWGFEARVGAMLSEREDLGFSGNLEQQQRRGNWDFWATAGSMAGRGFVGEVGVGAGRAGRNRRWGLGLGGVKSLFGSRKRRNAGEVVILHQRDEDVLPPYTVEEPPPAYEQ